LTEKEILYKDQTCFQKSKLLYQAFSKYYPTRYRACQFFLKDLNLPANILKKIKVDGGRHYYIEVYLNNQWIVLDASFDRYLQKLLPVNRWDGKNNTNISVNYTYILSPKKSEETAKVDFSIRKRVEETNLNKEFFKELNEIYKNIRKI
jgi:hypothetical protein